MADTRTGRQKFASQQKSLSATPVPRPPKIPDEIKKKFPDLEQFWTAYDEDWEKYFKAQELRFL